MNKTEYATLTELGQREIAQALTKAGIKPDQCQGSLILSATVESTLREAGLLPPESPTITSRYSLEESRWITTTATR